MLGSDLTQDGQLGADECFTYVDGHSVDIFSTTSLPQQQQQQQDSAHESAAGAGDSRLTLQTVDEDDNEDHQHQQQQQQQQHQQEPPLANPRQDKLFTVLTSRWTDKKDQVRSVLASPGFRASRKWRN